MPRFPQMWKVRIRLLSNSEDMGKIKLVNHCTFIAKHLHILRALSCVSQVLANNSGKKKNNTSDSRSSDNNFKDISYYFLTAHNTEETNHVLYKGYFFF